MERTSKQNNYYKQYIHTLNDLQISISQFSISINGFHHAVVLKQKVEIKEEMLLEAELWINHTLTNLIDVQKNVLKKKKLIKDFTFRGVNVLSDEHIDQIIRRLHQLEGKQTQKVIDNSPSLPWLSNELYQRKGKKK